jgi:hypothetical protein
MIRFLKFFYRGPGAILAAIAIILGICGIIKNGQDKQKAEAEKRQVQRPLGEVKPTDDVDAATAAKEKLLADQKLHMAQSTQPVVDQPVSEHTFHAVPQRQGLPTLVSFYTQVAPTPTPAPLEQPQQPKAEERWLPPSIFIPCALVNTIESSHINTPVEGEVIHDVCQNGKLIIPAGTIVSSFAQSGAVRDRIEVAGTWLFVFADGRHLKATGIACDREANPENQQFGIEDGSAGIQGELIESDHWANAKAFLALLITSTTQAGTAAVSGAISHGAGAGVGVGLPDTTPIMSKYLDQLLNGETGDGRFVRVRSSKEFYIFPTDTILPTHRAIVSEPSQGKIESNVDPTVQAVVPAAREILKAANQQETTDGQKIKF